jgi:Mg-chelatase subunit ChlD
MLFFLSTSAVAFSFQPALASDSSAVLQGHSQSNLLQGSSQSTLLQGGSQSTLLQGGSQSTLLQGGSQSTLLQSKTDATLLQGGTAGTIIQGNIERVREKLNILFLLDCSFSMKEKFKGLSDQSEEKMSAAKQVLERAMERIPADVNVGLRVFGQGFSNFTEADCRQTALLMPLGVHNRASMVNCVRQIKPFGLTPLEYALRQAAEDDFRDTQGSKVIILISDGADTCGGDPCAFIRVLPRYGISLKCDIVGLAVKEKAAREQLNCIAESSGGKYYDANSAGELIDKVSKSVEKAISGRVIIKPSLNAKNTETLPESVPIPNTVLPK